MALPQWPEAARSIHPILRRAGRPSQAWRLSVPPLMREVAPWLVELLAYDGDVTRTLLQERHLTSWGRSLDEVRHEARSNLDARALRRVQNRWVLEGFEATARALLPGWLQTLCDDTPSVVAVPRSDLIIIAPLAEAEGLLREAAVAWRAAAEPISPALYTPDRAGVQPWLPPEGHPAARVQHRHTLALAQAAWADLQDSLSEHPRLDNYVLAGMRVEEGETGYFTMARWREGVRTCLPPVDVIEVFRGGTAERFPFAELRLPRIPGIIPAVYGAW